MKTSGFSYLSLITIICSLLTTNKVSGQTGTNIVAGAYYFDGWSGLVPKNIIPELTDQFPERKPIWGWVTSDQKYVEEQIDMAADHGLSFFCFDYYYRDLPNHPIATEPLNRALGYYLNAPNNNRLKFCLLVCNNGSFNLTPQNWAASTKTLISIIKNKQYLTVNGKPLLVFISAASLIKNFGSVEAVHQALDSLRILSKKNGLPGLTIGVAVGPLKKFMDEAKACGFDAFTGYNYSSVGFKYIKPEQKEIPIDTLVVANKRLWDRFNTSPLPFMPVLTLNWDPRSKGFTSYYYTKHYTGYCYQSNYQMIKNVDIWMNTNKNHTTKERIVFLYAWNEYNEGAWLTPSELKGDSLLLGIKDGLTSASKKR